MGVPERENVVNLSHLGELEGHEREITIWPLAFFSPFRPDYIPRQTKWFGFEVLKEVVDGARARAKGMVVMRLPIYGRKQNPLTVG